MIRYLGLRVLQAIAVLWATFTVSFAVLFLLPSDPVSIAVDSATTGTTVDAAAVAELQARYGLDQPVWVQYWNSLSHAVRGDFGYSIATGQSVTEAIGNAVPSTLALASAALVLAVVFGAAVAFLATYTSPLGAESAVLTSSARCRGADILGGTDSAAAVLVPVEGFPGVR